MMTRKSIAVAVCTAVSLLSAGSTVSAGPASTRADRTVTAHSVSFGPIPFRPDLTAAMSVRDVTFTGTGAARVIHVNVRVTIRNRGVRATQPTRVTAEHTRLGEWGWAAIDPVSGAIDHPEGGIVVPAIAAGAAVVVRAVVSIPRSAVANVFSVRVLADSCAGLEHQPASCWEVEYSELNNASAGARVFLAPDGGVGRARRHGGDGHDSDANAT